jgi:hypothetical protein
MGLNKDSMDAARALPRDDEPATPKELSLRISTDSDRRNRGLAAKVSAAEARCKAELDARGFDLAMDWAHAMEAETAAYYTDRRYEIIEKLVRHFPGLAAALRAVHTHIEDDIHPNELGRCCVRTDRGWPAMLDEPSYPA